MEGGGTLYRGTSMDQDGRFSNKDKKLMKQMKVPPEFSSKVDIKKVDLAVITPWIHRKIIEYLGEEDELLINYIVSALEQPSEKGLDPRGLQIHLTGFLEKNAAKFMKELWILLLEAQAAPNGIPAALIEDKKDEILQQKQELEDNWSKLESIKAFMGGDKPTQQREFRDERPGTEDDRDRNQGREVAKANMSKLASKLKNEREQSNEKEEDSRKEKGDVEEKSRDKGRDRDRERRRDDDRRDRHRDRDSRDVKDRRREKERERERDRERRDRSKERQRHKDRERERQRERERERERSKKDEKARSSKNDKKKERRSKSSSGDDSSSSESRERSKSKEKRRDRKDKKRDSEEKDKRKEKQQKKKKEESSSDESSDSDESGSDSDSSDSDSSGSESEGDNKK